MNIVVTGATGFVGRHLVPRLLKKGHSVLCLVRSPSSAALLAALKNATCRQADITRPNSLRGTVQKGDIVIHLAVLGNLRNKIVTDNEFFRVNVEGTRNLLEECAANNASRVIVATSSAALGPAESPVIDEATPAHPITPYGRSKHAADQLVDRLALERNLPVITLRFTHIYGPGDTRDLFKIVRWIKSGVFPQIGYRPNHYPAVYIDDAVESLVLSLTKGHPGGTYIITDDDPHDTRKIRRLVRDILGLPRLPYPIVPVIPCLVTLRALEWGLCRLGTSPGISTSNIRNLASSRVFHIDKARRELGFEPKVDFETGLRQTIDWYRSEKLL